MLPNEDSPAPLIRAAIPGLCFTMVKCPEFARSRGAYCNFFPESDVGSPPHAMHLINMIIHLNDHCGWTREQIADWLDTLDIDLSFPTPDLIG